MDTTQPLYPSLIIDALRHVRYPGNGKDIVELGMVEDDIRIEGRKVSFSLIFERPTDPFIKSIVKAAEQAVLTYAAKDIDIKGNINVKTRTVNQASKEETPLLPGVKNIIGIASGKGGVGKSTVAANMAVALARQGYRVGLLDADIFGPSIPKMFGVEDEPLYMEQTEDGRQLLVPIEKYGVKILSIGFLVDKNSAVLWRGGMASNALRQLISQAQWGELDYFLIDMPPGTSDIHLTLVQTLPITGVVIVSTPQEVALADARKGIAMFTEPKVNVPVLGVVENMSWFTPAQHPDEKYYIFGDGGALRLAEELHISVLAQIPLVAAVGEHNDGGQPIATEDSVTSAYFAELASRVVQATEKRNADLPPTSQVKMNK
ncbi:MAG: Mrp/NBP35 family ATP-binding protein [Muribaculaceae bacterium]|nr:Mrp/NBP35 family ATP-binding protein [Muribaculaceae bacterium]